MWVRWRWVGWLTRIFAALAGGQRRHVLLEQERGRSVIVILAGRQPLVRLMVHGRVVAVLGLVTDVTADAADPTAADADANAAAQHRAAPAVQRRRADGRLGAVLQVLHVDGLLLGRPKRGLLELEQSDLLSTAFQRQTDGHAGHQQHGHGQRPGDQSHVRLCAVARTRSCEKSFASGCYIVVIFSRIAWATQLCVTCINNYNII